MYHVTQFFWVSFRYFDEKECDAVCFEWTDDLNVAKVGIQLRESP